MLSQTNELLIIERYVHILCTCSVYYSVVINIILIIIQLSLLIERSDI